jgi:hypothetical protein
MDLRMVTDFDDDDLFVRTTATIKNTGANVLSELYCECTHA